MYFAWKEEYSVNVEEIDNQHKKLFEIGGKVSDLIFTSNYTCSKEDLQSIINELKKYTEFHFKFEEKLMREYGYAHYETHKYEHKMLIEKIEKIELKCCRTLKKETLLELINFIFEWISHHILDGDMKYSEFLSEHIRKIC